MRQETYICGVIRKGQAYSICEGPKHNGAYRQRNMVNNSFISNNATVCMVSDK